MKITIPKKAIPPKSGFNHYEINFDIPKNREILRLLKAGYSNYIVREKTGASLSHINKIKKTGGL